MVDSSPTEDLIVRVASKNRPGYYWSVDEGIEGYLMMEPEMFRVVNPGLWGPDSISFESLTRPEHYIVQRNDEIFVERGDIYNEDFRRDCSWFARNDIFFPGMDFPPFAML